MIEAGIAVGGCLLWSLWKMPWKWKMHILSNPMTVDAIIFLALLLIHWGTFTGVMAATIGAGICSASFSIARRMCGHVEDGRYVPGFYDFGDKIKAEQDKRSRAPIFSAFQPA